MAMITLVDPQTAGISGDMLLSALIDAGADLSKIRMVMDLIPAHFSKCKEIQLQVREVERHGFRATAIDLSIDENSEETKAKDLLGASEKIAEVSGISKEAVRLATKSVEEIVNVESKLHGKSPENIHLHEAGSADTLADAFGVATACDSLGIFGSQIYSTPVAVGSGLISFSHGTMGVPTPAVLEIARQRNIPICGGPENLELTTPTGISLLSNLAHNFVGNYPLFLPEKTGYGAGKKELKTAPNVLRVITGRSAENTTDADLVTILETNLDDLSGEMLGHALQRILDSGAKDAWVTSAQFKKNRPGQVLHVMCQSIEAEKLANVMMEETGTLGVRYQQWNRFTLQREIKTIKMGIAGKMFNVRVKFARDKTGKIIDIKPEFDDVSLIAKELSIPARKVAEAVLHEVLTTREQ